MQKVFSVYLTVEQIKLIMRSIENDDHENDSWLVIYKKLSQMLKAGK
jgi:hypothetical protein